MFATFLFFLSRRSFFFINVNYYAKCETVINNDKLFIFQRAAVIRLDEFPPWLLVDESTVEMINIMAFASPFI